MNTQTQAETRPIRDARGKRPTFYEADGVDQLMSMVMVLASEINVLHDRLDAQERVAAKHGIAMADEIETLEFDEEALQQREAWRQSFFERLLYVARKTSNEAATHQNQETFNSIIEEIAQK